DALDGRSRHDIFALMDDTGRLILAAGPGITTARKSTEKPAEQRREKAATAAGRAELVDQCGPDAGAEDVGRDLLEYLCQTVAKAFPGHQRACEGVGDAVNGLVEPLLRKLRP